MWGRLGHRIRQDAIALLEPPWRAVIKGRLDRFWLGPAAATAVLILSEVARSQFGLSEGRRAMVPGTYRSFSRSSTSAREASRLCPHPLS